jgi:hypothetical protein
MTTLVVGGNIGNGQRRVDFNKVKAYVLAKVDAEVEIKSAAENVNDDGKSYDGESAPIISIKAILAPFDLAFDLAVENKQKAVLVIREDGVKFYVDNGGNAVPINYKNNDDYLQS